MKEPDQNKITAKIQKLLGKEIIKFELKGKGAVNNAYYIETSDSAKYIVKQEREIKEFEPQNDLRTEARVIEELDKTIISVPLPHIVFVSEDPKMYCYEYIEGEMMKDVWLTLSKEEKINICRKLGEFHSEIGKEMSKDVSKITGLKIDGAPNLHPEVSKEYDTILSSTDVPEEFKILAKKARSIFDRTMDNLIFQFIHNDSHHENILIRDKKISGIIDFGNAEYGEVAKEFSRYIRDFPDHFQYIVSAYEKNSGNKLSYERLITNAFLSGLMEILEDYRKGGKDQNKAEETIRTYKKLIER